MENSNTKLRVASVITHNNACFQCKRFDVFFRPLHIPGTNIYIQANICITCQDYNTACYNKYKA